MKGETMDRELRILILEDDSTDAELMQRELRNAGITFSPMLVASRKEFIKGLDQFSPDLILADYKLPSFDGISALAISQEKYPDIPFIFVTGTMGEEWAVETLKRGACDYVLKDRIYRLASVVKRALQDAKERTGRKQAEEKYRGIFTNALEGIFQVLPDGRYITANPSFVNMLGYKSQAEFIAKVTAMGYQLCVQLERYNELKQLLKKHNFVHEFEIQMYRKDGNIIWISLNAHSIYDDHGTLLYYEGTAQNITEQKKIRDAVKPSKLVLRILGIFAAAEVLIMLFLSFTDIPHGIWENLADTVLLTILCAPFVYLWIVKDLTRHLVHEVTVAQTEAQANEYRYHTLIDTAPDIVYTFTSGNNIITLLNPAFETITGWPRDEWIGKTFVPLVHPDDLQFAIESFQQILKDKNPPPFELRILTKSGTYFICEITGTPQFELGKIVGVLGIIRDITERKRAEKEIAMLAHSLRSVNECVSITDMEDNILFVNASFLKTYGYDENELVGKHVDIVRSINNQPELVKEILPATIHGGWQGELWNKRKDGSEFPIYLSTTIIYDKDNKPLGLIGVAKDITERKLAEDALRESEDKFRSLVENISDVFYVSDQQGKFLYCSPNFFTISGYSPQDIYGNSFIRVIAPIDRRQVVDYYLELTAKGSLDSMIEFRFIQKDGSIIWVEQNTRIVRDPNGKIVQFRNVARDITVRKLAEEALRESEASLAEAQRIAHIGNWELDIFTHKLFWSEEVYSIFGFEIGAFSLTMEAFFECVHPDDRMLMNKVTQASLYEKKTFDVDHRIILPNGKVRVVHEMAEVIFNETGQPIKMVGTVQDITDRKLAEEELIIAKEHAEESDRLKSAFLANMSHEIRTPMNGILGFAEMLKEPKLTGEEQQEYLSIIEKSGARMLNIINDIVDISKIESGLMKVNVKESNVNEQIEYIYTFFKPEVEGKGIRFFFKNSLPLKEAILKTDREKVSSILINLVKNAIKYCDKGTIEFGYDLVKTQHATSLQFFVKDTGIGIPKDRQEAVFDRFVQADIGDKRAFQGAGLGLSISKAYVEMLGGKIWVESEEGKGSIFYFTIPFKSQPHTKRDITTFVSDEGEKGQIRNLKLLIVEDDETSDLLILNMLKKISHRVLHSETGVEAIETCRNNPDLDLVLMDIKMPDMDGYEATRQIRQFNNDVVIIAQTAFGLSGDREKAIEAGCNDYIAKPINKDGLLSIIQKYFKK
ncbi:MAG: PAS domain S-box protein [Bacteroidota bacterium]|nr:PAS domain S-box protein [Bacteroidota bacterium]